ncbi:ribonuclease H-like domain-containing protein [Candidatus Micrarchaeota archaeon]|nr:ribonuclease H-like domain-containing protein [Candidatus Micrarchaeota archaeon]
MTTDILVREWSFPLSLNGTIIDLECTSIKPEDGEIVTFGVFCGNKITIYQRTDPSESGKVAFLKKFENWKDFCIRPYFAYNKSYEEMWLKTSFDSDLMEKWKKKAENERKKWPRVSELVSMPHNYYGLSDIEGAEVPILWEEYKKTSDVQILDRIIHHDFYDLVREACLCLWHDSLHDDFVTVLESKIKK